MCQFSAIGQRPRPSLAGTGTISGEEPENGAGIVPAGETVSVPVRPLGRRDPPSVPLAPRRRRGFLHRQRRPLAARQRLRNSEGVVPTYCRKRRAKYWLVEKPQRMAMSVMLPALSIR